MRAGWPRWSRSNRLLPSGACGAPHARTSSVQMSCGPSSLQSLPRSAASTSGHRSSPVRRGRPTRSGARPLPLSEAAIRTSAGLRLRCSYRSAAAPRSDRGSPAAAAGPSEVTPTFPPGPAPTLERELRSVEKKQPSGRPRSAERAPLRHSPARPHTQGHARPQTRSFLRWSPVPGAAHYHVALWRNGTRVLDLWPARPSVAVPREWVHNGTRYRTQPGKYLWLVYPGDGPKSSAHYGPLVAAGVLVIRSQKGVQG